MVQWTSEKKKQEELKSKKTGAFSVDGRETAPMESQKYDHLNQTKKKKMIESIVMPVGMK